MNRPPPVAGNPSNVPLRTVLLLLIVLCVFYWLGNGRVSLFDRDEPRFAQPAREMLAGKTWQDWIVPHFNGEPFFHKPPLSYWQMAVAFKSFGVGEFAARFFSGLWTAVSAVLILCYLARRVSVQAGLLGAAIFATSLMVMVEAKLATADATLNLLVLLAVFALWDIHRGQGCFISRLILGLSVGGAILCKGPTIFVVLAGLVVVLSIFNRDVRWLGRTQFWWTLPLALAVGLPWYFLADHLTGGELVRRFVHYDLFARVRQPLESHRGFPGFYVLTALVDCWPWSGFLIPAAIYAWRKRTDENVRFLLAWLAGPTILLELVRTKMVHYWLIVLPAYAILLALMIDEWLCDPNRTVWLRWRNPITLSVGVVWVALGLGVAAAIWFLRIHGPLKDTAIGSRQLILMAVLGCGPFFLASGLVLAGGFRRDVEQAFFRIVLSVVVVVATVSTVFLPILEPFKLGKNLANELQSLGGPKTTYALIGWQEPSTTFYLYGPNRQLVYTNADHFWNWAGRPDTVVVVAEKYAKPILSERPKVKGIKLNLDVFEGRDFTRGGKPRSFYIFHPASKN